MTVAIRSAGLGKQYRSGWALRDCNLQIPAGRICALVGPNGAGKTTLLRLALGLLKPSTGDISVFGWSPTTNATLVLARVGYVPQDRPLYRRFTVDEMLHLGRRLNPRWDQEVAAGRLRRLDIPLDRQVGQLSGGQQAQVSLALALGKRPDLLLLDEPVSNLDPLARRQFLSELVQVVAADGLTVVLSSHVVAELERVCDHLVILNSGRVQVMGEIEALLELHKLVIAPSLDPAQVARDQTVVQATHTERQSALLVKVGGKPVRSDWETHSVSLEDMVLAYLGNPSVSTLPAPALEEVAG